MKVKAEEKLFYGRWEDLLNEWGCFIIYPKNTIALLERAKGYGIYSPDGYW